MENLNEALSLLAIGMLTVFVILILVTMIGNVVIRSTNHFISERETLPARVDVPKGVLDGKSKLMAAIIAVVDVATKGKGHINNIEKNN